MNKRELDPKVLCNENLYYIPEDVHFELSYGGIPTPLTTVLQYEYDQMYYLLEKLKAQKEYERKEHESNKPKK